MRLGRPSANPNGFSLMLISTALASVTLLGHIVAIVVIGTTFALGIFILFVQPKPPTEPPVQRHEHTHYQSDRPSIYPRRPWPWSR
jgi:hypothetical protein